MCGKDLAYALGGDVYAKGGTIECGSCSWSWDRKDGGDDMYVCHKCGTDNTNEYKNGGITINNNNNNNMKKNNLIKPKRKGKNIMTLAKEIRKKDESWQDALKRAKIEMNKTSSKKSSNIDSELGKLKELIKEDEILKEYNYSKKNTKKSNTRLQKGGDVMSLGIANADAVYNKGGKLSKDDAITKALKLGVDFNKDFHSQSFGNELSELAKETGYRKSKSSSGSLGRSFFNHLQKIYDKNSSYYDSTLNSRGYAKGGEIETKREFVEVVNQVKEENEALPNDFVNVMDSINAILQDRGYEEDDEYTYDVRQEILDRYEEKVLDKQGLRFAKGGELNVGKIVTVTTKDGKKYKGKVEKTNPLKLRTDPTSTVVLGNHLINKIDYAKGGKFAKGGLTYMPKESGMVDYMTKKPILKDERFVVYFEDKGKPISSSIKIAKSKRGAERINSRLVKSEEFNNNDYTLIMQSMDSFYKEYPNLFAKGGKTDDKGRKYADGGTIGEYPRVYIADLEAYNNGELKGEWLDLADYNDSEEFNDAVQDLLDGWGVEEYAIHDVENFPDGMYSEYMGTSDFDEIYDMIELAKNNDLPLDVVMEVVSQYDESAVEEYQGQYEDGEDFAYQMIDEIGLENFNNPQYFVDISDTDRRIMAQEMADSYVDDIVYEDDGERVVEEAGLDVDEYRELDGEDDDKRDEILEEAKEIVRDEYYETWYDGLDDPYDFLVNEQGFYSDEDFFKANFIQIDYGELANALEQDYLFIENDKGLFVFNVR
jgi:antirestriction protein